MLSINSIRAMMSSAYISAEEKAIMRKLLAHGIKPTGDITTDRNRLHEIELKEAEQLNCISNKFLTVTPSEQEKILNKKKEKQVENNNEISSLENTQGAKLLGEQIYLAIQMKQKKIKN